MVGLSGELAGQGVRNKGASVYAYVGVARVAGVAPAAPRSNACALALLRGRMAMQPPVSGREGGLDGKDGERESVRYRPMCVCGYAAAGERPARAMGACGTLDAALTSAPLSSRCCTSPRCPFCAATMRPVHPSCARCSHAYICV